MAANGDPVLAQQMTYWQSVYETRQQRFDDLRSKLNDNTPLTLSEDSEWKTLNSPGQTPNDAKQIYELFRTQYLATVPIEEEPLPVFSTPPQTDTPEAIAVAAVQDRYNLKQELEVLSTQKINNQTRIDYLQSKESLTAEETAELATLISDNSTIDSSISTKRVEYQTATITLNAANNTLRTENKDPLIDDGNLVTDSGAVITPATWPSEIQGSSRQNITNQTASSVSLQTLEEKSAQRRETYASYQTGIDSLVAENKTLQAKIYQENQEAYQDSTPQSIQLRQQRIADLTTQLNNNEKSITEKKNTLTQLEVEDRQLQATINERRARQTYYDLSDAKSRRTQAIETYRANEQLYNDESNKPIPDPVILQQYRAAMNAAYSEYSQADSDVATKKKQWAEEQKKLNENTIIATQTPTVIVNETRPAPTQNHIDYGVIDESEYEQWKSGERDNPGQVYDTYTGKWVSTDSLDKVGLQNQRYVYTRDGGDYSSENAAYKQQVADIESGLTSQITFINNDYTEQIRNVESNLANFDSQISVLDKQIQDQRAAIDDIQNNPGLTQAQKNQQIASTENYISDLESQKDIAKQNKKNSEDQISSLKEQQQDAIRQAEADANRQKDEAASLITSNTRPTNEPVTREEAQTALQILYVAQEREDLEKRRFFIAKENGERRCAESGGTDCSNPANWTNQADIDSLIVAKTAWQESRTELFDANGTIRNLAQSPNGVEQLKAAGFTEDEIAQAQQEALNPDRGSGDPTSAAGNAANSSVDKNAGRRMTGFESLNQAAPFYFQLPSLKAISDFHLRNGYSPYGPRSNDSIARDAVHFNMFELNPPAARAEVSTDGTLVTNKVQDQGTNLVGTFTVYPNTPDWLDLSHVHTWGNENLSKIANMADSVLGIVDTVQSLTTLANNLGESAVAGMEQANVQSITRKIDAIDTYQSTNKVEVTIPFVLFTKNSFLYDIYRPLMLLTAMTYPKRMLGGNLASDVKSAVDTLEKLIKEAAPVGNFKSFASQALDTTKQFLSTNEAKLNNWENNVGRTGGFGPFRYYVSKRPEYMSMRHASGIIYFPMCYITNIKYNFKGPWYNYDGKPFTNFTAGGQIEKVIGSAINRGLTNFDFNDVLGRLRDVFNFSDPGSSAGGYSANPQLDKAVNDPQLKQIAAYPSIAECSITVRNALPFFRDDWMQMYNGATNPQDLINVSVRQTGQSNLITPNGSILRPPVGLNTGDVTARRQTSSTPRSDTIKAVSADAATESSVNPPPKFAKDNVTGRYDPVTGARIR